VQKLPGTTSTCHVQHTLCSTPPMAHASQVSDVTKDHITWSKLVVKSAARCGTGKFFASVGERIANSRIETPWPWRATSHDCVTTSALRKNKLQNRYSHVPAHALRRQQETAERRGMTAALRDSADSHRFMHASVLHAILPAFKHEAFQ
jgi:hypothetical protein